jgi:hypothetical protein
MFQTVGLRESALAAVVIDTSAISASGAECNAATATQAISNASLLAAAQRSRPLQSWYDENHEGLY